MRDDDARDHPDLTRLDLALDQKWSLVTCSHGWPFHRLPQRLAEALEVPDRLVTLHEALWREVYLAADILDDLQDGDLEAEPAKILAPLVSVRGLARCMALAGQAPDPVPVLSILSRTLNELVEAQAWDLRPRDATGRQLVASLEGRTGATMAGMLETLAHFSPLSVPCPGALARWGRAIGAALQWRSDLDAAAEAGPSSPRWHMFVRTLGGLGLSPPASPGLVMATVRLHLARLSGDIMDSMTGTEPSGVSEALNEALGIALDLRLAGRRMGLHA
ncbi:MAG: class 1 isoprenoid biosynthesis enzyme [Candidatus Sericytochromatia bacterium]|nr:class 1 isoprenoid biosynthesis enzyme [Candidatus Sericytochromatia bacterium]